MDAGKFIEAKDSFHLAQNIVNQLKKRGFNFPPVLALEKELKKIQAQNFLFKRRINQKTRRYVRRISTTK